MFTEFFEIARHSRLFPEVSQLSTQFWKKCEIREMLLNLERKVKDREPSAPPEPEAALVQEDAGPRDEAEREQLPRESRGRRLLVAEDTCERASICG